MKQIPCPRDASLLASNDVYGCRYYTCGQCEGYWIPAPALRRNMRPEALRELLHQCSSAPPSPLRCLRCDSPLAALTAHGCEIDLCPRCHALWLDHDEILRLASVFQESQTIIDNAPAGPEARRGSGAVIVLDGILNLLTLFLR